MKLLVTIDTGKVTREIILPVGNGSQTFKWLGYAAAYRIVHDVNRYLPKKDPDALPLRTQLLPKKVYTEDCPFLHPYDTIKDHLADGAAVMVDLHSKLEVDEYGAPLLSEWAFVAFRHAEHHQEKRNSVIEEKKLEVETFRRQKATAARIAKMEIEKPKISFMKVVMEPQLISDEAIAATFNEEWALIKNSGILDNIVPDEKQQDEIHDFILKYFVEINDLYKFYSAVNSGGGTHTLEYIELTKFLTETNIIPEKQHSNAVLRIFLDSHIGGRNRPRPSIHSEIRRHEFFVALIKISILRNITMPKKELAKLRKKGHQVAISTSKLPSIPKALEMIYTDYLSPVLEKMPAGSKMRAAVGSDNVMILFYDHLKQLAECFEKYSGDSGEEEAIEGRSMSSEEIPGGSMNVAEFGAFANDAGFVDASVIQRRFSQGRKHSIMGNRTSSSITQKDVRQIFSASQHDNVEANESEMKKVEDDDNLSSHQELMIFSEFLEAVARLGVLKYHKHPGEDDDTNQESEKSEDAVLSHYECIKLAVEKVCSMA